MKIKFTPIIAITCIIFFAFACKSSQSTSETNVNDVEEKEPESEAFLDRGDLRFVFYNVENLFDTFDDSLTQDEEFLPWGMQAWSKERYEDKLKKIFKVLVNVGGWELPEMIGLCEIENRFVLEELIRKTPLSREKYGVIHEDSPDARGIDLGFLYRKDAFFPIHHQAIRIKFPMSPETKTRDILYIEGLVNNKKDKLHIFVCHFPSRRGGQADSEPRRVYVAEIIRAKMDSILATDAQANIVVTGDFNDEPTNNSIVNVLQAKGNWDGLQPNELYNFMYKFKVDEGLGTYKFQGYWNMLDQYIVSQGLMNAENPVYLKPNSAQIYKKNWLMQEDTDNPGQKPFRTYGGALYYGGYSDHLPIYLDIFFNK
jgi:predicted extracellular nuclease